MPWLVAHRGAMTEAPENTKAAFDKAVFYPIDGIELDVQITRDGIPVIFHDKTLRKINGNTKTVSDYTVEELRDFKWGLWFSNDYQSEKILTLEQVLLYYSPKTRLFIEIKSAPNRPKKTLYEKLPALVTKLIRDIVPAEFIDNMHILSFDKNIINLAYQNDPDLNYVLNLKNPAVDLTALEMDILQGSCLAYNKLTREIISFFHNHNKKVMTYSCNTRKIIKSAISLKVDVIMTDDPGSVYGYFSEALQKEY